MEKRGIVTDLVLTAAGVIVAPFFVAPFLDSPIWVLIGVALVFMVTLLLIYIHFITLRVAGGHELSGTKSDT